jgi:hypothetical protein
MKLAVNQFILSNPTTALHVAEGLVAVGAGLTLRHIMKSIGVQEADLPERGMAEVELLDENKPDGFFHDGVVSIHASLIEHKMRGDIALPQLGWRHGLWRVTHRIAGFREVASTEQASGFVVTDIATPVMNENGVLV